MNFAFVHSCILERILENKPCRCKRLCRDNALVTEKVRMVMQERKMTNLPPNDNNYHIDMPWVDTVVPCSMDNV